MSDAGAGGGRPPGPRPPTVLFLVGYRGVGKTTVARLLAGRLGWEWADADRVLEEGAGKTVRQIFQEDGEASFRDREAVILARLCARERCVVATGGGVVLQPENRDRLRRAGRVVWLTADAATIEERLRADPTTAARRPDLSVGGRAEVEEMLRVREPLYRACAHVAVDTAGLPPEAVADAVLARVGPLS